METGATDRIRAIETFVVRAYSLQDPSFYFCFLCETRLRLRLLRAVINTFARSLPQHSRSPKVKQFPPFPPPQFDPFRNGEMQKTTPMLTHSTPTPPLDDGGLTAMFSQRSPNFLSQHLSTSFSPAHQVTQTRSGKYSSSICVAEGSLESRTRRAFCVPRIYSDGNLIDDARGGLSLSSPVEVEIRTKGRQLGT